MTYDFKTPYSQNLYSDLSTVVPIVFIRDDGMSECARMNFDEGSQKVQIRYTRTADEFVDIAHELLHVRMQFRDGFPLLAWPSGRRDLTPDIEDLVEKIRNAVDDTYVLRHLFADTGLLPISQVFYREIRKDLKRDIIHVVQSDPVGSRPIHTAWRLRVADLSLSEYDKVLSSNQRQVSTDFISRFQSKDPDVEDLFINLKQNVMGSKLSDEHQLGDALIGLRDKLGLPSWLHLATYQKINGTWGLRPWN
jgi:hypothetical protein